MEIVVGAVWKVRIARNKFQNKKLELSHIENQLSNNWFAMGVAEIYQERPCANYQYLQKLVKRLGWDTMTKSWNASENNEIASARVCLKRSASHVFCLVVRRLGAQYPHGLLSCLYWELATCVYALLSKLLKPGFEIQVDMGRGQLIYSLTPLPPTFLAFDASMIRC